VRKKWDEAKVRMTGARRESGMTRRDNSRDDDGLVRLVEKPAGFG
jgi:hypothetical protein